MATFGTIITRVSKRLKDPNNVDISASDVATAVNDAIQYWSKKNYWFNEFEETITLTNNGDNDDRIVPALTVTPLYLFKEGGFVITYAQSRWDVKPVTSLEFDNMNVEGRGIPYAYTERNDGYEVYYYPDQAYTATLRGIRAYSEFATDGTDNGESNVFTNNAERLIMYDALARLFGEEKQDPKMETYYQGRAQDEHRELKRQTLRKKKTNKLHVEGI